MARKLKAGLNKKDFIFANEHDKELTKSPGQIRGQAFQISNLTNCSVFLMDHLAQVCCFLAHTHGRST